MLTKRVDIPLYFPYRIYENSIIGYLTEYELLNFSKIKFKKLDIDLKIHLEDIKNVSYFDVDNGINTNVFGVILRQAEYKDNMKYQKKMQKNYLSARNMNSDFLNGNNLFNFTFSVEPPDICNRTAHTKVSLFWNNPSKIENDFINMFNYGIFKQWNDRFFLVKVA